MPFYQKPTLSVVRFSSSLIFTVSGEAEWDTEWDEALKEESTDDDA